MTSLKRVEVNNITSSRPSINNIICGSDVATIHDFI
jgi:hypothetical protein